MFGDHTYEVRGGRVQGCSVGDISWLLSYRPNPTTRLINSSFERPSALDGREEDARMRQQAASFFGESLDQQRRGGAGAAGEARRDIIGAEYLIPSSWASRLACRKEGNGPKDLRR